MIFGKKWRGLSKTTGDGVYIARKANMRRLLSEMNAEQVYGLIYFMIDRISDDNPFEIDDLENIMCEFCNFKMGIKDLKLNEPGA